MLIALMGWGAALLTGCAKPAPELFPLVGFEFAALPDGGAEHRYDLSGDGRADYVERLAPDGRITALRYDTTADGTLDLDVTLDEIPDAQRRDLIILLDSIPHDMVLNAWQHGRLRFFPPPSRVISPFPVMTDLCFSEFFGNSPCPGVESAYFDGERVTDGVDVYLSAGNVPWKAFVDYALTPIAHAFAYTEPLRWYDHELYRIREMFHERTDPVLVGYVVGTSALGARIGRDGHQHGLVRLDRFCRQIMYETRGRTRITLLSDHGHFMSDSRRIPLRDLLTAFGYRVHDRLERPGDVVLPEFGMVTCAVLHTHTPAPVAQDLTAIEGIDLVMYRGEDDGILILSRDGRAHLRRLNGGFVYREAFGDPLALRPVLDRLTAEGHAGPSGEIPDRMLFEATLDHPYPDGPYRIWRAFNGLIEHTPDVMISIHDGWHHGSEKMARIVRITGAHGNLNPESTNAFAMTTAGALPADLRMDALRRALLDLGVPVPGVEPSAATLP